MATAKNGRRNTTVVNVYNNSSVDSVPVPNVAKEKRVNYSAVVDAKFEIGFKMATAGSLRPNTGSRLRQAVFSFATAASGAWASSFRVFGFDGLFGLRALLVWSQSSLTVVVSCESPSQLLIVFASCS